MNINIPNAILLLLTLIMASLVSHPAIILLFLFLIVAPGLLLYRLFIPWSLSLELKLIISTGIGLAAIPLFTYLFKVFSIPLTGWTIFTVLFLLLALNIRKIPRFTFTRTIHITQLILIGILFLSIFTRLYPIQDIEVPPFADPALQGIITTLIIEQEGIPSTWEPFLSLDFRHQPGFASIIAWFSIFSSVSIPKLILFFTNIIHALFPFSLYLLAYSLFKNRIQSTIVATLGLIAMFPTATFVAGANSNVLMYMLSVLTGGVAILFVQKNAVLHKSLRFTKELRKNLRFVWLFFFLFIGGILIHPTFFVFFSFIGSFYLIFLLLKRRLKKYLTPLITIIFILLLSIAITSPFFLHSAGNESLLREQWNIQAGFLNPEQKISPYFFIEPIFFLFNNPTGSWYFYLENLSFQELILHGAGIIMTALFLYAVFFIKRTKDKLGYSVLMLYLLFLALSSLQSALQLEFPGWNILYPSRIKFLMILPIALIIAFPFAKLQFQNLKITYKLFLLPFTMIILVIPYALFSITSQLHMLSTLSPFSESDRGAMVWIKENIPKDAIILNTIKDVEAGVFIGGSGQWIPTLTKRAILFPPLSLTEDVLHPSISGRLPIMRGIEARLAGEENFLEILRFHNVQYVFLSPNNMHTRRELFGDVGAQQFLTSPLYNLEYQNGDTYIFSVIYSSTTSPNSSRF